MNTMQNRFSDGDRPSCTRTAYGLIITSLLASVIGCQLLSEKGLESRYYVLECKDAHLLDGPYELKTVVDSTRIVLRSSNQDVQVFIRGCIKTGDQDLDAEARGYLLRIGPDDAYLRKDCSVTLATNALKSVVYAPANKASMMYPHGEIQTKVLTYRMPQLLCLLYGYCLLDHSDTNYPLYRVFAEAEKAAKRNRKGYWATHKEPPATAVP